MALPYIFKKSVSEAKLENKESNLGSEYRIIKLYNVTVKPFEERFNLTLEITIGSNLELKFPLSKLTHFHNSEVHSMVLFSEREAPHNYRPVILPEGFNNITYKVIHSDIAKDFEVTLNCSYD